MSRKPSVTTDPLLAALIAKLPASETPWPVDRQLAWLRMMAMGFATVYGGDVLSMMSAAHGVRRAQDDDTARTGRNAAHAAQMTTPPQKKIHQKFILDLDGIVKRTDTREAVNKDQVTSEILDLSNGGIDVRMITWADGSQGINGCAVDFVVG
jgi:hypothetical protein